MLRDPPPLDSVMGFNQMSETFALSAGLSSPSTVDTKMVMESVPPALSETVTVNSNSTPVSRGLRLVSSGTEISPESASISR